jgi:hypothetical protein
MDASGSLAGRQNRLIAVSVAFLPRTFLLEGGVMLSKHALLILCARIGFNP